MVKCKRSRLDVNKVVGGRLCMNFLAQLLESLTCSMLFHLTCYNSKRNLSNRSGLDSVTWLKATK